MDQENVGSICIRRLEKDYSVFEYISKGSLHNHLTDELRGLEWHTRYQTIKGICDGLQYLHKEKDVVHMDLKPHNILMDDLMIPKITDFGVSKHLDGISQAVTGGCHVSLGYCAPEYLHRGQVSFKSDIFSLGVIIIDLVTGRKEDPDTKIVRLVLTRNFRFPCYHNSGV
ncbi:cysteine-rich receptor-like protein kinase 6 [Triticum aestivum]|uniref:cysteine-rich receptor-like protein kinase 6 n=1 Tax=Triticum aestivum TaxID=4565 RepID=UPI001D01DBBB|nr:cysteine-rich receptor-like protein kinase 6 [Triticum aestivum]XP_045089976.1 cysteine-rich receptor-like protein kinase 6 [Aegilops tauschii subsp. strangulata]